MRLVQFVSSIAVRYRFRVLASAAALAFGLGLWGYLDWGQRFLDALYSALGLFGLDYATVNQSPPPVPLEVARFLAPVVTGAAAVAALLALLKDEADGFRASRASGHVLICGAGDRGVQFARAFVRNGLRVVGIERNRACPGIDLLRELRIPVIVGDALDPHVLRRARADRAAHIICVAESDDTNAAIAMAVTRVPTRVDGQQVHCHVSDPAIEVHLTSRSVGVANVNRIVEWFNLERLMATALLSDYFAPLKQAQHWEPGRSRGYAIVGATNVARSLLIEGAKQWHGLRETFAAEQRERRPTKLPVTVVDCAAEESLADARSALGGIDDVLDIAVINDRPTTGQFNPGDYQIVFVAVDEAVAALRTAIELEQRLEPTDATDIVVPVLVNARGLADALQLNTAERPVHVVNMVETTCTTHVIEHGLVEQLARENHRVYEKFVPGQPASRPWEQLDPMDRESNRRAAAHHIRIKVPKLGARVAPIRDLARAETFVPSAQDIEVLAELEHVRWMDEKLDDGWHHAAIPEQDREQKLHPDLVPWKALSEPSKEKDRIFVRELPRMFNACGYRLVPARTGA